MINYTDRLQRTASGWGEGSSTPLTIQEESKTILKEIAEQKYPELSGADIVYNNTQKEKQAMFLEALEYAISHPDLLNKTKEEGITGEDAFEKNLRITEIGTERGYNGRERFIFEDGIRIRFNLKLKEEGEDIREEIIDELQLLVNNIRIKHLLIDTANKMDIQLKKLRCLSTPSTTENKQETILDIFQSNSYRQKIMVTNPDDACKILVSFFLYTFALRISKQEAQIILDQIASTAILQPKKEGIDKEEETDAGDLIYVVCNKYNCNCGDLSQLDEKDTVTEGEEETWEDKMKTCKHEHYRYYQGGIPESLFQCQDCKKVATLSEFEKQPSSIPVVDYEKEAEELYPYPTGKMLEIGLGTGMTFSQQKDLQRAAHISARQMSSPSDKKTASDIWDACENLMMNEGRLPTEAEKQKYLATITPADTNCKEVQFEFIFNKYQEWCKLTHRNGAVLIGSSIKEFFKWVSEEKANSFIQQKSVGMVMHGPDWVKPI